MAVKEDRPSPPGTGDAPSPVATAAAGFDAGLAGLAGALVVLRAFSSGAVALTGV